MAVWLERNIIAGGISYFFEAGCQYKGEADHFLNQIKRNRELKKRYRMDGHKFVPKLDAPQLQQLTCWRGNGKGPMGRRWMLRIANVDGG